MTRKRWSVQEDKYLLSQVKENSISDAIKIFQEKYKNRTDGTIRWRLSKLSRLQKIRDKWFEETQKKSTINNERMVDFTSINIDPFGKSIKTNLTFCISRHGTTLTQNMDEVEDGDVSIMFDNYNFKCNLNQLLSLMTKLKAIYD